MIVPRGPVLTRLLSYVGWPLLLLFLYDIAVVLLVKVLHQSWLSLPHIPLALLGSAIGILMGFRNNSSYARWWEARTLWGAIVNNSRSWARQVLSSIAVPGEAERQEAFALQRRLIYLQIAWAYALKQQLRGLPPADEMTSLLRGEDLAGLEGSTSVPFTLQRWQAKLIGEAKERGWLDSLEWQAMDATLNDLLDVQGGSERIRNTPMPKQYDFYPRLFVQMYCLLLPLALVGNMGWFTPLGSTAAGFIFLALDKIGRDLEDPFDNSIHDVPLTSICRTIERNLREALGESELPAPLAPDRGVLW